MEILVYLGLLFAALLGGAAAALVKIIPQKSEKVIDFFLTICLYALLLSMGIKTGLIENIGSKLSMIGFTAFAFALVSAGGSLLIVLFSGFVYSLVGKNRSGARNIPKGDDKKSTSKQQKSLSNILSHLKEPALLIGIVIVGAIAAASTDLFFWFSDSITEWLLYVLLFLVGVQMVQGKTDLISVLKNPISLALPLLTIFGTLLGSSIIPLFFDIDLSEALAVGAGFGWYSLSGVLISDLGDPVLGSIAFLSNLFRESAAFLLIPLLAGFGKQRAAISVCGATSMDVTLPMVEKFCGVDYVPLSLAHGILLTLVVPFLVPILYASGIS